MRNLDLNINPFKVFTPEDMDANDVHNLFVNPFTDFNKVCEPGHTMVTGPRGCGKSMIFRYLLPDCQCLALENPVRNLPFLAFLISIKNTVPNLTEFRRLGDKHANIILNEHFLTIFVAAKVFQKISQLDIPTDQATFSYAKNYLVDVFNRHLKYCGGRVVELNSKNITAQDVFHHISKFCDYLYSEVVQYTRRLTFLSNDAAPYNSALCGFIDFLFPILSALKQLPFLPTAPVYLLIDDADYLNKSQTIALNSWISTRTQGEVSIKFSTQLQYKTFDTASGLPIQSPHDFQSINIADIYTTKHSRYLNRVEEIVKLRLRKAGIMVAPRNFFPCDQAQEDEIKKIAEKIRSEWPKKGRGHRPSDDAIRYARPEYIRSLGGVSKSRSTYSYAGFEHLVHISSGLVRYFLEPAAVMYDEQKSLNSDAPVDQINPSIQNRIVRDEANRLMLTEFDLILQQEETEQKKLAYLNNLIRSLGGTFLLKLISDDAERRVFSVAISGKPDPDVIEVFELGVRYAYFHGSSIGNKDGTGRTRLYVLTRRLAPYFTLDPTSFAGYLWTTSYLLREAMINPDKLLRRLETSGVSQGLDTGQLTLFD